MEVKFYIKKVGTPIPVYLTMVNTFEPGFLNVRSFDSEYEAEEFLQCNYYAIPHNNVFPIYYEISRVLVRTF